VAFDKDKFWDRIQRPPQRGIELSESEGDHLRVVLSDSVFLHALNVAFQEIHTHGGTVLGLDLSDPKMVARAMNLQGRAQGVIRFVEAIIELIPEVEKEAQDG